MEDHFLKIEEIRVCDCFINSTIKFLREIRDLKCVDSTQCVDEFQERFDKITLNFDLPFNRIYSLFGKISVICCELTLYQCDYLDFVSNEELFADCYCDMMLVDDTLDNYLYYSEYDLSNMERLCINSLYNDCSRICPNEAADPNSLNCIDLFEYGFENFCVGCLNIVSCFLIKNLHTFK